MVPIKVLFVRMVRTTFSGTVDAGALTIGGSSVDTSAQVDAKIAALVDGAPTALNTLNELAAALNDQSDYASSITSILDYKGKFIFLSNCCYFWFLY